MAYTVESKTSNPATQLRDALDRAERLIVQLNRENVESFLVLLDDIELKFDQLAQDGVDLRPEQARWQSLLNRISGRPGEIAGPAAAAGGLAKLRSQHPPADSFWWHVDAEVGSRRRRTAIRVASTFVVLVVVVAALLWGINYLFPPNPDAVVMVETTHRVDQLIVEQRWEEALLVIQDARRRLPNDPELAIWESVLYERMGNTEAAAEALAEAQALHSGDLAQVWLYLGNNRLMVGDLEGAAAAAREAEAVAPDNAMVYFLQGGVAEAQGDIQRAIELFDKTFQVAGDDNAQLAVIARVRMGQLLQRPDAFTSPAATPTPTP